MTDETLQPAPTEDELLALNIGIEPHIPIAPPLNEPIKMIDGSAMNYMHDHVHYWLSEFVYKNVINLPQEQKDRYFKMITEYGDVIQSILNDDNNVIYEYASGNTNPWANLEAHAEKSGAVVDFERPKQLIKEYQEWRTRQGL